MKKILVFMSIATLTAYSCNSPEKTETTESETAATTMSEINSPYEIGYSSKFTMGDPKNAETVLNLWKAWDNGDLMAVKDMFADSVEMFFSNGYTMHSTRDSVLAAGQAERNNSATAVSSVDAVMAVKSIDKNEDWALIWGKEIDTDKKGNVDSFYLQETWRFNKDGKIDRLYQFRAAAAPPKQ